jgi:outer membrane usher protein
VPFGAEVLDEQGVNVGVVGQASRLIVRGADNAKSLIVSWGDGRDQRCKVDLPALSSGVQDLDGTQIIHAECRAVDHGDSAHEIPAQNHVGTTSNG